MHVTLHQAQICLVSHSPWCSETDAPVLQICTTLSRDRIETNREIASIEKEQYLALQQFV
jgi:hypothetical protein